MCFRMVLWSREHFTLALEAKGLGILRIYRQFRRGSRYRSHPNFRNGCSWYIPSGIPGDDWRVAATRVDQQVEAAFTSLPRPLLLSCTSISQTSDCPIPQPVLTCLTLPCLALLSLPCLTSPCLAIWPRTFSLPPTHTTTQHIPDSKTDGITRA